MLSDFADFFIPQHVRNQIIDRIVDTLAGSSSNEHWRKLIRSFRSDGEFHAAFERALKRAIERFTVECSDKDLVNALIHNTRFWDIPSVQNALKEIVTRPASYLEAERNTLMNSFADVLPTLDPQRVERAVQFFMHCLAGEVINIPQLAPIYQVQLQRASLDQAREMVAALRELQADQRQWVTALLETVGQNHLLPPPKPALAKVHHNLPPQYGEFLGREKDIARVLDGLNSRWPLVSIEGLAGIGKTTLAIEVAHQCLPGSKATLDEPFEVVVWVSASNRPEQKQWMNELLDTVARVLGYPYVLQVPPEQKPGEIDQLLRQHRTLVLVDNFETIDDPDLLEWIQRVPEPSKAMITTRHHHLRRVWDIHLRGLADAEALELIRFHARRLGLQAIATAEPEVLLPLVRVTEGTPRVIELAIGYVKGGSLALGEVVEHLYAASETVDDIFDYLFARAWEIMTRDAQQILLVMPFFADSASKEALGAVSALTGYRLDSALKQLVELALLDINEELAASSQRYSTHPLTRAFASMKVHAEPLFEEQARERWGSYFVDFAVRNLVVHGASKESYWNILTNRDYQPIDIDWPNLRQVLNWADREEKDQVLIELSWILVHYMYRRILYTERVYYARRAAEAANKLNQKEKEAYFRIDTLGWIYIEAGQFTEALQEITAGLQIAQNMQPEDPETANLTALGYTFLARTYLEQGDVARAAVEINKVISIACNPLIQTRIYMVAGDTALRKEDYAEARRLYEQGFSITQAQEDTEFDARLRYCLGSVYLANGALEPAEAEFSIILDNQHDLVNIAGIYAKYGLARVAQAKGEREKALRLAQETKEALSRSTAFHQLLGQIDTLLRSLETN